MQDLFFRLLPVLIIWCSFILPAESSCQEENGFDEILIYVYVRNLGGAEMPAYIQGKVLYLPITNLFSFLKIQNTPSSGFDSVSGFFISSDAVFLFDRTYNRIHYQQTVYELNPDDFFWTENNLYLRSDYFGKIFSLNCDFDFRRLTVFLNTEVELPFMREMNRDIVRANISRLKGEMKTDTTIKRNYPIFHFGAADWSVSSSQEINGKTSNLVNLNLGGLFAGGEANINLHYSNIQPFKENQQFYQWHFANNDFKVVKQVLLGKFTATSVSSLTGPVIGFQVTNTPTTFNRSFGFYTITDYTEPGWIVELYVNYMLVDYVKADASGYFSFEVPLVYGNSLVKLRFYGPWGEEHSREQIISIPYNFIPSKKFEYTISAGMVDTKQSSRYARALVNYGLTRRLTIGGGIEYLSSISSGPFMPLVNFSLRLASSLLVSGEYIYGVRLRGTASYRLRSNLLFELYYTKMDKNQKAIVYNYLEERKAVISMPVKIPFFSSLFRLTLYQIVMPQTNTYSGELLISGSLFGVTTNLITTALFSNPLSPYVSSELALGFRLPAKFLITPRIQYVYTQGQFLSFKLDVEKRLFRNGVFSMTYNRNFYTSSDNFQVGVRYDFPFAQTNLSVRYTGNSTSVMEYARGSLIYEGKGGKLKVSNYSAVGRGGIIILPFLDLNANGKREKNEQKVPNISLHVSGGRIKKNPGDSTITISELEPFNKYFIELNHNTLDHISWRIPKATIGITVNPNQYKLIEIPVIAAGEVSGFAYKRKADGLSGLSNIAICFYKNDSILIAKTVTESDGYFDYLGLPPGSYTVKPDKDWLNKVRMTSTPDKIEVTLKQTYEGDIVDGLEFILHSNIPDTSALVIKVSQEPLAVKEKQEKKVLPSEKPGKGTVKPSESPPGTIARSGELPAIDDTSSYHVQVGAFKIKAHAQAVLAKLSGTIGKPVLIIVEDGLYKVRIAGFATYDDAKKFIPEIIRQGFPGSFVRKNR